MQIQKIKEIEIVGRPEATAGAFVRLATESVSAGFPSPAEDYIEQALDVNDLLVTNPPATFFVKVAGSSMVEAGIHPDDILAVDRSREARHGDIVIAIVNGELTVKELATTPTLRLIPRNSAYEPIVLREHDDFEIVGKVTGLVRRFK
ncbi:MAG: translesion error-prone DNA polymerase V autoproteolytic subunit [Desulfobulbus sp.]|uniref:LexA family protein n=1 Tax=Desulfobulbus sp. TaxID=895 RepID=UPI0028499074|nr:translesion error-prone DNA polymerase V autoproteolytic subunit [Desulfobulbus sp.]MDR2549557.1 translesion error-prone DNA polymerase V autoproteolytic subunit [Desulfobulbus sp.]